MWPWNKSWSSCINHRITFLTSVTYGMSHSNKHSSISFVRRTKNEKYNSIMISNTYTLSLSLSLVLPLFDYLVYVFPSFFLSFSSPSLSPSPISLFLTKHPFFCLPFLIKSIIYIYNKTTYVRTFYSIVKGSRWQHKYVYTTIWSTIFNLLRINFNFKYLKLVITP